MTRYRTIVPNGNGGGTTYRDHIVNPTFDGVEAVRIADARGGMVQVSDNGVTGWEFYYAAPGSIFADDRKPDASGVYSVTTTAGAAAGLPPYASTVNRATAIELANELHSIRVKNGATGTDSVRVELAGAIVWAIRDNGQITL